MIDNDKNQPNKSDTTANNEEAFVSKIYTQSKSTHIPERIDAAILAHAKTHLATKTVINKNAAPLWRKWQFSSSIAASVLVVSVIYMLNPTPIKTEEYASVPNTTPPQETSLFSDDSETKPQANTLKSASEKRMAQETALARLSDLDASKRRELIQTENERRQALAEVNNANVNIDEPIHAGARAIEQLDAIIEELDIIEKELRLNKTQIFNEIERVEGSANSLSNDSKQLEKQRYLSNYKNIQRNLFEQLKLARQNDINWKLDEKFKPYLQSSQIKNLSEPIID